MFFLTLIFLILWNLGRFFARMAGRRQNSRSDGADRTDRFHRPDENPFEQGPWRRGLREKDVTDRGRIIEEKNGDRD